MVNQVTNIKYNNEIYNDFALTGKDKNFLVTRKNQIPEDKQTEVEKVDKSHKLAVSVGISALSAGFIVLAIMRGPKGFSQSLSKIKGYLEKKVTKNVGKDSNLNQFYLVSLKKVNSIIEKSESINNFTSLKDVLFKKLMSTRTWAMKIHDKTTKIFEKVSRKTIVSSWNSTKHNLNNTFKKLKKYDEKIIKLYGDKPKTINGVTMTGREWVKFLKQERINVAEILGENTSKNKLISRYKKIKSATEGIDEVTFEAFKNPLDKKLYQTFIADELLTKDKEAMFNFLNAFREQISFNREYKLDRIKEIIKQIENYDFPKDIKVLKKLSDLKHDIKKGVPNDEIITRINELKEILTKDSNLKLPKNEINKQLDKALGFIKNTKQGKMDEILKIYEELLPDDIGKIKKETSLFTKSLDESINKESKQFFDKVRDLQIGSAPTDVISIVASGILIGFGLLKADNRDERVSVMLKSGVPVIGALLTSLYCTARLVSGGKAMGIALLSGWVLNIIGKYTDKLRKKLQENALKANTLTNAHS